MNIKNTWLSVVAFLAVSAIASLLFVHDSGGVMACTPTFTCTEWSGCIEGIESRTCVDTSCGTGESVERRLCAGDEQCTAELQCSQWSECNYMSKASDALAGQIKFSGFEQRSCVDVNGCTNNFVEERKCTDSFDVKFSKVERCGITMLVALDANSNREVSQISSEAWQDKRLNIAFVQSNFSYCPHCYNGYADADEEDIDCGGSCKSCAAETIKIDRNIVIASSWIAAALLMLGFAASCISDKSSKVKLHLNMAFRAVEKGDTEAAQKHLSAIKKHYSQLPEKNRKSLEKDLQKLYRRI